VTGSFLLSNRSNTGLLVSLFLENQGLELLYALLLLPPVFASFGFCLLVVLLETLSGCSSSVRRSVEARIQKTKARREEAASADPETGAVRARTAEDFRASAPAPSRMPTSALGDKVRGLFGCSLGVSLPATSLLVVCIDAAEMAFTLKDIYVLGWTNMLLSGVMLKLTLMSAAIMLGEGVLRSSTFAKVSACWALPTMPLETWVRAHRMARDIFVSLLIFLPLTLFVALNSLNESLCPSCNVHQLCLYRDPGHVARKEQDLCVDLTEDEARPAAAPPQRSMPATPPLAASSGSGDERGVPSSASWSVSIGAAEAECPPSAEGSDSIGPRATTL